MMTCDFSFIFLKLIDWIIRKYCFRCLLVCAMNYFLTVSYRLQWYSGWHNVHQSVDAHISVMAWFTELHAHVLLRLLICLDIVKQILYFLRVIVLMSNKESEINVNICFTSLTSSCPTVWPTDMSVGHGGPTMWIRLMNRQVAVLSHYLSLLPQTCFWSMKT